jgi:hypothetical protein
MESKKVLTDNQRKFLDYLFDEAQGDPKKLSRWLVMLTPQEYQK